MQAVADTGASHTAGTSTATVTPTSGTYTIKIFGGTWSLTWDKWIWSIIFICLGVPMCFLTISMWKLFRIIYGGIIGFFVANALEVYCIMPFIYPNGEAYSAGWKIGWYVAYCVFALLGVIFFWKCPKFSISIVSAWLLYMVGLQFNGWLAMGSNNSITPLVYLLIAIGFAVGGFFLGCYFPNFTIMLGTAAAGAFLSTVGVGIMTQQYPGESAGERTSTWWVYFCVQMVVSVLGFMFQFCWGYRKHDKRVDDNEAEMASHETHMTTKVEVRM